MSNPFDPLNMNGTTNGVGIRREVGDAVQLETSNGNDVDAMIRAAPHE